MPIVIRPAKANGNTTYVGEVESGKLDIIDQEVDEDFRHLYEGINNLDDDNISGNPKKISYTKLNLAGAIKNADIVSLDAAKLFGFLPHTIGGVFVDGSSLQAGTVPSAALIRGASCFMPPEGDDNATLSDLFPVYGIYDEVSWTTRTPSSGPVVIALTANLSLVANSSSAVPTGTVHMALGQGGTPNAPDGSILREVHQNFVLPPTNGLAPAQLPVTLVIPFWAGGIVPAPPPTLRFKLLLRADNGLGGGIIGGKVQHVSSILSAVELT